MANLFLKSSLKTVARDLAKHHLNKEVERFLFVLTASETEEGSEWWLQLERDSMTELGYELEDYTVTGKQKEEVARKLDEVDGVVMAGGNTFFLLQEIQLSASAELLRQFVKNGGVYIGSSAGSIVAGPDIYPVKCLDVVEKAPRIAGYEGLALVDFVAFCHWGSDYFRDAYLRERMYDNYNLDHKIILLTDNQYMVVEKQYYRVVDVEKDR